MSEAAATDVVEAITASGGKAVAVKGLVEPDIVPMARFGRERGIEIRAQSAGNALTPVRSFGRPLGEPVEYALEVANDLRCGRYFRVQALHAR